MSLFLNVFATKTRRIEVLIVLMKIDSIIIAVLYGHFSKMQERGRKVIPWFQTVAVLSSSIAMIIVLLIFVFAEILTKGYYKLRISESEFIIVFILSVTLLFALIKRFYFNTNKHLLYLQEFNSLTVHKQKNLKFIVLSIIISLPFILLLLLYLFDNRK